MSVHKRVIHKRVTGSHDVCGPVVSLHLECGHSIYVPGSTWNRSPDVTWAICPTCISRSDPKPSEITPEGVKDNAAQIVKLQGRAYEAEKNHAELDARLRDLEKARRTFLRVEDMQGLNERMLDAERYLRALDARMEEFGDPDTPKKARKDLRIVRRELKDDITALTRRIQILEDEDDARIRPLVAKTEDLVKTQEKVVELDLAMKHGFGNIDESIKHLQIRILGLAEQINRSDGGLVERVRRLEDEVEPPTPPDVRRVVRIEWADLSVAVDRMAQLELDCGHSIFISPHQSAPEYMQCPICRVGSPRLSRWTKFSTDDSSSKA